MARRAPCNAIHAGLVCLALVTTACASGGSASPGRANELHTRLTASEIRQSRFDNAYDAVRHLRPMFLNSRGPTSALAAPAEDILVIINGQVLGGVDELRAIEAVEVLWVRRLTASDVYFRLGRTAPSGGIEVRTVPCRDACS